MLHSIKFKKNKAIISIISIVLITCAIITFYNFREDIKYVRADSSDNSTGYAWSSNFGWISFNCTNDTPECASSNYGVSVDPATGDFSGYAWSPNAGWIDFAPVGPYPETPNYSAQYSMADSEVTGWAKVLAWGVDGWIKMNGSWTDGVSIDPATGDFSGYAWNGADTEAGMGWVSFNCSNTSTCATSNFKVNADVNRPPTIASFSAPNWNYNQACTLHAKQAILRWVFDDLDVGSSQTAYQVIFDDDNDPADPIIDTGKLAGNANQYLVDSANLNYNTAYYYWVKVWDDHDVASNAPEYTMYSAITDSDNDDGNVNTFTTYAHELPSVDFSWTPNKPSKDEDSLFTDQSDIYLSGAPSTAVGCSASNCSWSWSATNAVINDNATSTPIITFNTSGNQTVTLITTNTDGTGYYCSDTVNISVKGSLPGWGEVKPE